MAFKSIYTSLYLQGSLAPTVELWYWWTSTRGFGGGFFFKFVQFEVEKNKKIQIKKLKVVILNKKIFTKKNFLKKSNQALLWRRRFSKIRL